MKYLANVLNCERKPQKNVKTSEQHILDDVIDYCYIR